MILREASLINTVFKEPAVGRKIPFRYALLAASQFV